MVKTEIKILVVQLLLQLLLNNVRIPIKTYSQKSYSAVGLREAVLKTTHSLLIAEDTKNKQPSK